MRPRFLKEHYIWEAFLLDLERELKKVKKSELRRTIRSLTRKYFIVFLKGAGASWQEAKEVLHRMTDLRTSKRELAYLRKSKADFSSLKLKPDGRKALMDLKDVLGRFCPQGLERIKVYRTTGERVKKKIEERIKERRKLKVIDNVALRLLDREFLRTNPYGKNMNLKRVSIRTVNAMAKIGINLPEKRVYEEIRDRLYRKYRYIRFYRPWLVKPPEEE